MHRAKSSVGFQHTPSPAPPSKKFSATAGIVVTRGFLSEKQRLQFGLMTRNSFGAFSPQWTIPSSRPERVLKDTGPGPGQYNVPSVEKDLRYPHVIAERKLPDYETITSGIEIPNTSQFPKPKPAHIGSLDGQHYYLPMPVSPSPNYAPTMFDRSGGVKIGERHKDPDADDVPGPGTYSPTRVAEKRSPAFQIPHVTTREFWPKHDTPGPGSYEVTKGVRTPTRWASKLRVRTEEMKQREAERERPWAPPKRELENATLF